MSEEATLDAFAVDDEDGDGADGGADASVDSTAVDPAAVTSSWGDGGTCAACGESAGRLWVDGQQRVCTACKSWA